MIQGGTALTSLRARLRSAVQVRALPGASAAAIVEVLSPLREVLLPPMRAVSETARSASRVLDAPGLDERGNVHLARQSCVVPLRRPAASLRHRAGMLQQIGIPTIVCGPGEIRVAHRQRVRRNQASSLPRVPAHPQDGWPLGDLALR
jgi:acetylornithine deacetylase